MTPFSYDTLGSIKVLRFRPWVERGIVHGFIGSDVWMKGSRLEEDKETLSRLFGPLIFPEQKHTNSLCITSTHPIQEELSSRDGVILEEARGLGAAVKTADCLPVLFLSHSKCGAVHAGWRGLAAKILTNAAQAMGGDPFEVVIGPAAGPSYEVGEEVIEAIGPHAVFTPSPSGRYYLDLSATAVAELRHFPLLTSAHVAPVSTMSDQNWHSHRRQGQERGNNIALICS